MKDKLQSMYEEGKITEVELERAVQKGWIEQSDIDTSLGDLETLKLAKIESLSLTCNKTIISGFVSAPKGESKLYDFEEENQMNMEGIKNNFLFDLITEYEYYAKGEPCETYTKAEFLVLYNDAMNFKFYNINKYKALKEQVKACQSIEELDAIVWTEE